MATELVPLLAGLSLLLPSLLATLRMELDIYSYHMAFSQVIFIISSSFSFTLLLLQCLCVRVYVRACFIAAFAISAGYFSDCFGYLFISHSFVAGIVIALRPFFST